MTLTQDAHKIQQKSNGNNQPRGSGRFRSHVHITVISRLNLKQVRATLILKSQEMSVSIRHDTKSQKLIKLISFTADCCLVRRPPIVVASLLLLYKLSVHLGSWLIARRQGTSRIVVKGHPRHDATLSNEICLKIMPRTKNINIGSLTPL